MAARLTARAMSALVLVVAPLLMISGCSNPESVCTAVGYSSTLKVQFIGDADQVAQVLVCGSPGCDGEEEAPDPLRVVDGTQVRGSSSVWTVTLYYPDEPLTVRALGAKGEVILEAQIEPEWERTGGTEECGGPTLAEVTLSV